MPGNERKTVAEVGERGEPCGDRRIAGQGGDQALPPPRALARHARGQHLDLHPRHIDARRAFAPAGLAGDAERHRLGERVRGHRVRPELAGEREPERVRPPARQMLLLARRAKARAHHARIEGTAGAVVVAHLDRAQEPAERAGMGGPVEHRGKTLRRRVARAVAKEAPIIHPRRIDDAVRVEERARVERLLHGCESRRDPRPEHRLVELAPRDAVAVLAAVAPFVFANQGKTFLGDRAHRRDIARILEVEHRADMQAADRGVRVPRPFTPWRANTSLSRSV